MNSADLLLCDARRCDDQPDPSTTITLLPTSPRLPLQNAVPAHLMSSARKRKAADAKATLMTVRGATACARLPPALPDTPFSPLPPSVPWLTPAFAPVPPLPRRDVPPAQAAPPRPLASLHPVVQGQRLAPRSPPQSRQHGLRPLGPPSTGPRVAQPERSGRARRGGRRHLEPQR